MRTTLIMLALLFLSTLAYAESRISGVEHVKGGRDFSDMFIDLIPLEISEAELTLFSGQFDAIETWANENKDAWNAVNGSDDAVKNMLELKVWESVDLTGQEFLGCAIKLMVAREIDRGNLSTDTLKEQMITIEQMFAEEDTTDEAKADLKDAAADTKRMIDALGKYPEANTTFFKANEEKISDLLDRLDAMGT